MHPRLNSPLGRKVTGTLPIGWLLPLDPLRSGEVGPIFSLLDIADGGMVDPIAFGDLCRQAVIVEYVEHLIFRQLCATIFRPTTTSVPDDPVQHVVLMGARLQMPRVHAERIIAAVTNYEPFRDPAMKVFVAKAMSGEIGGSDGK